MPKELSIEEYENKVKCYKLAKEKTWKCPKGHILPVKIGGKYESVMLLCEKCYKGYVLTRAEVEAL